MKTLPLLVAIGGTGAFVAGFRPAPPQVPGWTVWIVGGLEGHLAPCGCTTPQSGGLVRRAGAVARSSPSRTVVLDAGGWVAGTGRQDELKGDAVAASLAVGPPAAVLLTEDLRRMGPRLDAWKSLSRARFVTPATATKLGPLTVAGAAGQGTVLLVEGGAAEGRRALAKRPTARLVVVSKPTVPVRVGAAWILGPGDRGKSAIRLTYANGRFSIPVAVDLGPEVAPEKRTGRIFADYLRRVDGAGLLDRLPRDPGDPFSGDAACASCHVVAAAIHEKSAHAHAYETLEKEGHARDPDCVGCHVVGLDKATGFRSRRETPDLARVGCESCHGAGAEHVRKPYESKMKAIGRESCLPCHTPDNSPRFEFSTYWGKIRHDLGKTSG